MTTPRKRSMESTRFRTAPLEKCARPAGSGCIYVQIEEVVMARVRLPRVLALSAVLLVAPVVVTVHTIAQAPAAGDVTFTKDVAPILQRSCQECHHADGVAPMALVTYEDVRPWAKAIKTRTALRSQRGAMPPFFVEKNIGIQTSGSTKTAGGRYGFNHMTYTSARMGEKGTGDELASSWPIHEVGRNADIFPPESGRLLQANSALSLDAGHVHANGRETKAHLEFAFKLFPKGYKPLYKRSSLRLGNGIDIDVKPNAANQELHAYATLQEHTKIVAFEPHLHAPGVRMCLEAIWGHNIQTLNCVGYDHNWVKQYVYEDDAAPLLPKGTIVHLIGFLDTTAANKNPADPRNWAGGGRRSVANMFIDLGYSVSLTEDQFQAEMAKRRKNMKSRNDYDIGCPLCWAPPTAVPTQSSTPGQESKK